MKSAQPRYPGIVANYSKYTEKFDAAKTIIASEFVVNLRGNQNVSKLITELKSVVTL